MNKKEAKYVYVMTTQSIGVILDKGVDSTGHWYRTDCDGVRDSSDLLFLHTKEDVRRCKRQLKAHISPSTKALIGIK